MSTAAVSIANLLYRYAEFMDAGEFGSAAKLFDHARIRVGPGTADFLDGAGMLAVWRRSVKIHPDGTPRTKHVVSNPIIDVDEVAGTATCRSYYTVLQATDGGAPQVIAAGRYHDEFEFVDGHWRFSFRDYSMLDIVGDLSEHLMGLLPGPDPDPGGTGSRGRR